MLTCHREESRWAISCLWRVLWELEREGIIKHRGSVFHKGLGRWIWMGASTHVHSLCVAHPWHARICLDLCFISAAWEGRVSGCTGGTNEIPRPFFMARSFSPSPVYCIFPAATKNHSSSSYYCFHIQTILDRIYNISCQIISFPLPPTL